MSNTEIIPCPSVPGKIPGPAGHLDLRVVQQAADRGIGFAHPDYHRLEFVDGQQLTGNGLGDGLEQGELPFLDDLPDQGVYVDIVWRGLEIVAGTGSRQIEVELDVHLQTLAEFSLDRKSVV